MSREIDQPRRTDPRSFAVRAVMMLFQMVIPLAIASVTIFDDRDFSGIAGGVVPIIALIILANVAIAYAQWTKLTYTVGDEDIRVESGVLSRAARSVPYERIQDVSLEQKLVPRLFGLVEVKFETGAGGKDDLSLSYLSEEEGERLREVVRTLREGGVVDVAESDEPAPIEAEVLFSMEPPRIIRFGFFEFSLAAVAVLAGLAQQFEFLLPFDLWDVSAWNVETWEGRLAGPGQWLEGLGLAGQIVGIVLAVIFILLLGVVTGLVRTALREWSFRLERTPKGLRRRRGLLTRTDLVMPLHRVQALRIGTGFLRRRFGWHSLSVISLASDSGGANHDAAPFAQMEEIAPIVGVTGFELPAEDTDWLRAEKRYRFDKAVLATLVLLPVTIALAIIADNPSWIVPAAGLAYTLAEQFWRWRHDYRALGKRQLYSRHGWFSPSMAIASRVKLQSVEIVQGPLARIRGYASLHLGLAGGKLRVHGMPLAEARRWRAAICDSIAGTDFSETLEMTGASNV